MDSEAGIGEIFEEMISKGMLSKFKIRAEIEITAELAQQDGGEKILCTTSLRPLNPREGFDPEGYIARTVKVYNSEKQMGEVIIERAGHLSLNECEIVTRAWRFAPGECIFDARRIYAFRVYGEPWRFSVECSYMKAETTEKALQVAGILTVPIRRLAKLDDRLKQSPAAVAR